MRPNRYPGTGGYGSVAGKEPECWWDICDNGKLAEDAMLKWLELGGRRFDDATSYYHQKATGRVMKKTSVPREKIFYVSKVGPSDPLGKLARHTLWVSWPVTPFG